MEHISSRSRKAAYRLVSLSLGLAVMGCNIPSTLYHVYQQEWDFSSGVLTLIFGTYALALIPTLILFGNLSDEIGRRRVVLLGIVAIAAASLLFSLADGVAWLFAARIVQGIAIGILSGAATAALAELHPRADRQAAALAATVMFAGGSAVGPLFGGLVAQYAPYPLVLPYLVHLAMLAPALCGVFMAVPETFEVRAQAAWRPRFPRVPADIRYPFMTGSAACFAGWAAGGLFLAVIPSYASSLLQAKNLAVAGAMVFVMFGFACATQVLLRGLPSHRAIIWGALALIAGLAAIVVAVPLHSIWPLLAGAFLDGAGLGLTFMGGLGVVSRVAPPERRAEVLSACYVITYAGLSLPVVGVGFAAETFGLFASVTAFASAMAVVALCVAFLSANAGSPARG